MRWLGTGNFKKSFANDSDKSSVATEAKSANRRAPLCEKMPRPASSTKAATSGTNNMDNNDAFIAQSIVRKQPYGQRNAHK